MLCVATVVERERRETNQQTLKDTNSATASDKNEGIGVKRI